MIVAIVVGLAGGAGAVARFWLDGMIRARSSGGYPWGTTVVNVTGSLLLGLITGAAAAQLLPSPLQVVAGAGFLGGYTTFSTASVETVRLTEQRRWALVALNAGGTLVVAVAAAALGWWIGSGW